MTNVYQVLVFAIVLDINGVFIKQPIIPSDKK